MESAGFYLTFLALQTNTGLFESILILFGATEMFIRHDSYHSKGPKMTYMLHGIRCFLVYYF